MKTILAIDDESSVRQSYRIMLDDKYRVMVAENGRAALKLLSDHHADLILLDLTMPEMDGLQFLAALAQRGEDIPVIVVTASNCVSTAVEAMKRGAREYVIKPFDVDEVTLLIERILSERREKFELTALREAGTAGFEAIIGESLPLMRALEMARHAIEVHSTVLITGESGTGKDLLARAIHSGGKRAENAFVPISCCAIPPHLVESELFGHERGAFTGATQKRMGKIQAADRGTLFLDEIGEMPLEAQAKLLRVLQDGRFYPVGSIKVIEVDVRFVCATNRDLYKGIEDGSFREDLFYRINVLPVELPPLRKRRDDIPRLVAHFVAKYVPATNAKVVEISPKAMATLQAYDWPGNVRELENTVQRTLICCRNEKVITQESLAMMLPTTQRPQEATSELDELEGLPLDEAVRAVERRLITSALERAAYVQSRAAEMLGTTRRILKYKMDQLEIDTKGASEGQNGWTDSEPPLRESASGR